MLEIRTPSRESYPDVFTPAAVDALHALAHLDDDRKEVMAGRLARRASRAARLERIAFLDPAATIARTSIRVQEARDGAFTGSEIPHDLQRQWIQGTGPGAKPNTPVAKSIRNVAYALLSGADGWMFDGEDALGQIAAMSLDNQRNLKLAIARDPVFLKAAEEVAGEMNAWAQTFFGRPIVADWRKQLDFTTKIFRARGLHLDDRHVRRADGAGFSASLVDLALYIVNNSTCRRSRRQKRRRSVTTCSQRSSGTSRSPLARSRPTCWWSSSNRCSSSWRSGRRSACTSSASTPDAGV
jgi:malate synthase